MKVIALLAALMPLAALAQPGGQAGGQSSEIYRFDATHSGTIDHGYPGAQAQMAITFERAVAGTYSTEVGAYSMTVNGSPNKVDDGTWPAGLGGSQGSAWTFERASTEYLSLPDASGGSDFEPAGDFTYLVIFTLDNAAGGSRIAGKDYASGGGGWLLYNNASGSLATIIDDGTSPTQLTSPGTVATGRTACAVITYDYISSGSSVMTNYVDEYTATTRSDAVGPVAGNSGPLAVGSGQNGVAGSIDGQIHHFAYWDGVAATEEEARHLCRQWRGTVAGNGEALTITGAAPPAILIAPPTSGTEPFLMDMPASVLQISKWATNATVGGTSPSATDNKVHRRSLETWAAGSPSGWTETSGGGTSDATENTTTMAHGGSSAQLLCDGVNAISLDSACETLSGSTDYWADAYGMTTAGTATAYVQLTECTDGACSVGCVTTTLWTGDPGANWQARGGTLTTAAGTNSGYVTIKMDTTSATAVFDAVSLYEGTTGKRSFCPGDTDATASCSAIVPSAFTNIPANGEVTIGITASSPWAGTDLGKIVTLFVDGTARGIANSYSLAIHNAVDEPIFYVHDSAVVAKTVYQNVANWAADTEYDLRVRTDGRSDGASKNLSLYWNSTWQTATVGAGTGVRSAAQTISKFGCTSSTCYDFEWGKILIQRGVQP